MGVNELDSLRDKRVPVLMQGIIESVSHLLLQLRLPVFILGPDLRNCLQHDLGILRVLDIVLREQLAAQVDECLAVLLNRAVGVVVAVVEEHGRKVLRRVLFLLQHVDDIWRLCAAALEALSPGRRRRRRGERGKHPIGGSASCASRELSDGFKFLDCVHEFLRSLVDLFFLNWMTHVDQFVGSQFQHFAHLTRTITFLVEPRGVAREDPLIVGKHAVLEVQRENRELVTMPEPGRHRAIHARALTRDERLLSVQFNLPNFLEEFRQIGAVQVEVPELVDVLQDGGAVGFGHEAVVRAEEDDVVGARVPQDVLGEPGLEEAVAGRLDGTVSGGMDEGDNERMTHATSTVELYVRANSPRPIEIVGYKDTQLQNLLIPSIRICEGDPVRSKPLLVEPALALLLEPETLPDCILREPSVYAFRTAREFVEVLLLVELLAQPVDLWGEVLLPAVLADWVGFLPDLHKRRFVPVPTLFGFAFVEGLVERFQLGSEFLDLIWR